MTGAVAADGVIAGSSLAEAVLKIDPRVIEAIQFSTVQELHGLASIHSYVDTHFFDATATSADGWFDRLTGYVAEQKAATYFEQMGHHVQFAPVSNQPVWDMLVDGRPVQIKEHLAGVKDFIIQHPDFEVFTDPDIAAAIKDPAVHGLDVLNKDGIQAATQGTVDGLDGAFSPGSDSVRSTVFFEQRGRVSSVPVSLGHSPNSLPHVRQFSNPVELDCLRLPSPLPELGG